MKSKSLSSRMLLASVLILVWSLLIALALVFWRIRPKVSQFTVFGCSVIIPFRNEAKHIPQLIQSLEGQCFDEFEVIFVNDHSTDSSLEVLTDILNGSSLKFKVIELSERQGKKAALTFGIDNARHDLIVTTDADCTMGPEWLGSMVQQFNDAEVKFVTGPVHLLGDIPLQRFQSLEMSALMGITALSIKLCKPTMANGANLAFRKSVFKDLNGYFGIHTIPSGDDELFMHKVHQAFPKSIRFNFDVKAKVSTPAKQSMSEMISQKRRWAGKWKVNKRWSTIGLSIFVLSLNLSQLVMIYEILTIGTAFLISLCAILLKFLVEGLFVQKIRLGLAERTSFLDYVFSFICYPIYAVYIAIAANFGSYEWKERRYS